MMILMKTFNKPGFAKDSISVSVEFFPVAMSAILAFSIGLLQPVSAAPSTAKPKAPPNIAEYMERRNAQLPEEQLAYTKFEERCAWVTPLLFSLVGKLDERIFGKFRPVPALKVSATAGFATG